MRHCSEMYKIIRKKFKITNILMKLSETLAFNYNQHIQQQIIEICNNKRGTDSRCTLRTERGIINDLELPLTVRISFVLG